MDPTQAAGPSSRPAPAGATVADRRVLRTEYRQIDEEARGKTETMVTLQNHLLMDMIHKTNELHKRVDKPREGALDANLFCRLTHVGSQAADKLMANQQGRTIQDFINALRYNYVGGSDPQKTGAEDPYAFNWGEFGNQVARYFKPAPGVSCMLGTMDVQPKVRKVVQRQARRPQGVVQRPDELDQIQEQEKQETDHNMEEMWKLLKQLPGSCPLAELVCNHQCFAQTIENLFTLSFLVRDSRVFLSHDAQQGIMVQVVDPPPKGERPAPTLAGKRPDEQLQFVMSITVDEWELMKQVVQPSDTKMPHRDQSAVMALNRGDKRQQQRRQQEQQGEEEEEAEEEEGEEEPGPSSRLPRFKKGRRQ